MSGRGVSTVKNRIPLVVGVTGHIALRPSDLTALRAAVKSELLRLKERCPNTEIAMLTSLAAGSDLLCADVARELGMPILAALPMAREDYRKDFTEGDAARFDSHCADAEWVGVVSPVEHVPEHCPPAEAYRQAGIYVVTHSHVLMALWDGNPPDNNCGTSAVVDIALHGTYVPKHGSPVHKGTAERVIHILAPRDPSDGRKAGEVRYLGEYGVMEDVLDRTDAFNRLAGDDADGGKLLPKAACEEDPVLGRMDALYHAASGLSGSFAKKYRRVLALLAAASTLLTFAFLMYDEAEAIWMILVCGAMLGVALLCNRYAVRSDCHCRYIEYRAMAEMLRVQAYLRYAGSRLQVTYLLTWAQSLETRWIADALRAINVGPDPKRLNEIRECWVEAQRDYHLKASRKTAADVRRSERVVRVALIISATLYVAALVFEVLYGALAPRPLAVIHDIERYRTLLKVALGTLSTATIFIANYYGKQSLSRKLSDHGKMAAFYARVLEMLAEYGQNDTLLERLAREELIENGNWLSYQRDNTPDISL